MADLIDIVQTQEVGAIVDLFELEFIKYGSSQKIYLYSGLDENNAPVQFSNKEGTDLNTYEAFPISLSGIDKQGDGPQARPTLICANIVSLSRTLGNDETDFASILNALGITKTSDFIGTRVTRRRTLEQHLQTSPGIPIEFPKEIYIVDRIASENSVAITFELASPLDIEGVTLPRRVVIGKYCSWKYQGAATSEGGCYWPLHSKYNQFYDINDELIESSPGVPIELTGNEYNPSTTYSAGNLVVTTYQVSTIRHNSASSGDATQYGVFRSIRNNNINNTPETSAGYWQRIDLCSKTLTGCKARFDPGNTDEVTLPFGAFPSTRKFK